MSELFNELFIFEMANNHQGSLRHGLGIVEEMAHLAHKHAIRAAVKLQYRDLDTFVHPRFQQRSDVAHIPRFLETRLSGSDFRQLVDATRRNGMLTICTPFDEASVDRILEHEIQIIKVASCSANDWPLLEKVASAGRPVIASTGGRSILEIDRLVSFLTHANVDFALMHCVALYPTPNTRAQMGFVDRLKQRYPSVAVGYSGHEAPGNLDVVKIAIAKGAQLLERHIGIATETVKLNSYSMNPEQTAAWLAAALEARRICGGVDKPVEKDEIDSLLSLARGTYLKRARRKGEPVGPEDVYFAMPCVEGQTTSGEYQSTMAASRDYAADDALTERRRRELILEIRDIIHDAKGMLCEAHVDAGKDSTIELSHHYGMERFRQWGALIVNVVNREYCKKLIVMLPGQSHPSHHHRRKEETFHVLSGTLDMVVNDIPRRLGPGDTFLLERGDRHSFTTQAGCIFEEVSTTHHPGDSYYEDERIRRLDPIERKTVLDNW